MYEYSLPDMLGEKNLIHKSIIHSLFKKNSRGHFLSKYSNEHYYPFVALALIKISVFIIQAYMIDDLINKSELLSSLKMNKQLKVSMEKIWKNQTLYTLKDGIDFLRNCEDTQLLSPQHEEYLHQWNNLLRFYNREYKDVKVNLTDEYDYEALLIGLIQYLKVLSKTSFNTKDKKMIIDLGSVKKSINMYPYFQVSTVNSYVLTPIYVEIDRDLSKLYVDYEEPFLNDEEKFEYKYKFNSRDDESSYIRKFLRSLEVQLPIQSVQVNGSFDYLQKIVDTTVKVINLHYGINSGALNQYTFDLLMTKFLDSFNANGRENKYSARHSTISDLVDLSNILWIIIVEIGVYNFIKKCAQHFQDHRYFELGYEVNHLKSHYETFNSRVNDMKEARIKEIKTNFPDNSTYYTERIRFVSESVPIIIFLNDLGIDTNNIIADFSSLTSIDDYILFLKNDEGGNSISSSEKIWKFLYCFYHGLFDYCEYLETKGDNSSPFEILDFEAESIMLKTSKKAFHELDRDKNTKYIRNLAEKLKELFNKMDALGYSHKYFGRKNMANIKGIDKFHEFVSQRNMLSHCNKDSKIAGKSDYVEAVDSLISQLLFLKTGQVSVFHSETNSDADLTLCIYPQVVSFRETIIKRNNISITGYEVYGPNTNDDQISDKKKLIITSQKINQFKEYYCIPHALRTTDEFMIEPFLIPCEDFDSNIPIH